MAQIRYRVLALVCALAFLIAACGEGRQADIQPPVGTAGPNSDGAPNATVAPGQETAEPTVVVAPPGSDSTVVIPTRDDQTMTPSGTGMPGMGTPTP